MATRRRRLVTLGIILCIILSGFFDARIPQTRGIVWSGGLQVPVNKCPYLLQLVPCVDSWASVAHDSLGRLWLAWAGKPQGANGTAGRQDIFYRLWNGNWAPKQQVTTDINDDVTPYVTALSNGTMMILWSSNRTGGNQSELFYQLFQGSVTNPYPTTGEMQLTNHPTNDVAPSAIQDLNGRIWVTWTRGSDIYYKYHDGTSWSSDFAQPLASSPSYGERNPTIIQRKDGKIMLGWASSDSQNPGYFDIYYSTTDGTIQTLPPAGIPIAAWSARARPFTEFISNSNDDKPSLVQARDGTLWFFWQKFTSTNNALDIYSVGSTNNGASWGTPAPISNDAGSEWDAASAQMTDNKVWVFWNIVGLNNTEMWYKTSDPILNIHDVGLTRLSSSSYFIKSGTSVNIAVGVANFGDYTETTTLTVQLKNAAGTTTIKTLPLSLNPGNRTLITFPWNSSQPYWGFWGRYNLTATLQTAPGETIPNQGDNSLSAGLIRISPLGDVDFDGDVDIVDAATLAFSYGATAGPPPSPLWNPNVDIDHNGIINIVDAATLAYYYGNSV